MCRKHEEPASCPVGVSNRLPPSSWSGRDQASIVSAGYRSCAEQIQTSKIHCGVRRWLDSNGRDVAKQNAHGHGFTRRCPCGCIMLTCGATCGGSRVWTTAIQVEMQCPAARKPNFPPFHKQSAGMPRVHHSQLYQFYLHSHFPRN
jgi:hypothetical protein